MSAEQTHLLHDALDLLVLKALDGQELHGFGISARVEEITRGALSVSAHSLYGALHRMERVGWLGSSWAEIDGRRPAKYYWLTAAGRRQLEIETKRSAQFPLAEVVESIASKAGLEQDNSRLASSLAREAAERERLNREMEIVRQVQQALLPSGAPAIPGVECAGLCRPAFVVGGDCYDFLPLSDGRLGLAIGDISGKGLAAALSMASLQAFLRASTLDPPDDLAHLMTRLNKLLLGATGDDRYATLFYAQYDPATRMLTWVNAGHNAPLLFHNGECRVLDEGGPVIGLLPECSYEQGSARLADGDLLLAYTDGVTEAANARLEEWGETRLREAVARRITGADGDGSDKSIEFMLRSLLDCADVHASGAPQHDDMTLVALRPTPFKTQPAS